MKIANLFRPKLLDTLKKYSGKDFTADLIAGLTVGIVALPLAMAFAIASGVPPAPPTDPLHEEKQKLEAARQELTSALERASLVLNSTSKLGSGDNTRLQPSGKTDKLT